jgi:hypothetical protein
MKKNTTLAAALFAAAVFTSSPVVAQDVASVKAVVEQYQSLVAQNQAQNMTELEAETQALAVIKTELQQILEAAPDDATRETLLQAAFEAAALLDDAAVSAVAAAAAAAGMSADTITAIAAATPGVNVDAVALATAAGPGAEGAGTGAGTGVAGAPGAPGFGGGSGGGGGTASVN